MDMWAICWKRQYSKISIEIVKFGANLSKANLSKANLSKANLSKANLSKANLSEANLSEANLSGIIGLVHVDFAGFSMYIQAGYTKIGCQYQSNEEWDQMDIRTALELGIEREHFEVYHAFYKAAMLILKEQTVSE